MHADYARDTFAIHSGCIFRALRDLLIFQSCLLVYLSPFNGYYHAGKPDNFIFLNVKLLNSMAKLAALQSSKIAIWVQYQHNSRSNFRGLDNGHFVCPAWRMFHIVWKSYGPKEIRDFSKIFGQTICMKLAIF